MKTTTFFIAGLIALLPTLVNASVVNVQKSTAGWTLTVDGQSYFVKGVGCNAATGDTGEDYLLMAKDMGANSVRTWGVPSQEYMDTAQKYGLMVDAGIWFNAIRGQSKESYRNGVHRRKLKEDALAHVRELKDHPALLFWNLGNEVFTFTKSEAEQKAFGLFLDDLIKAVHKEDPNHPVVYACAGKKDLARLKELVPSLDIVGANVYGSYTHILNWMKTNGYDRPVVSTEYGTLGEWDRKKDENGEPYDSYDHNKAGDYTSLWQQIMNTRETSLGGYAFVLGNQRNQASLTWNNINFGDKKRATYWALYTAYTGLEPANNAPKIRLLKLNRAKDLAPGEAIEITVTSDDPENDPLTYSYFITDIAKDALIVETPHIFHSRADELERGRARVKAPTDPGVYRLYATVEDGQGNIAIANRSISVAE